MTANKSQKLTRENIEQLVGEMRDIKIQLNQEIANRDKAVQDAAQTYVPEIARLEKQLQDMDLVVCNWCADNRKEAFGEAKSLDLKFGTARFRLGNMKLAYVLGWTEEKTLAALIRRKLNQFIRTKKSIDSQAIIAALGKDQIKASDLKPLGLIANRAESISLDIPLASAGKEGGQ